MTRTPTQIVHAYIHDVWDRQQPELVRELCADPMIRHYPGKRVELSHDDQVARITGFLGQAFQFEDVLLEGAGAYVISVWNSIGNGGEHRASGTEIFRIDNGLIAEVWNAPYGQEHWG